MVSDILVTHGTSNPGTAPGMSGGEVCGAVWFAQMIEAVGGDSVDVQLARDSHTPAELLKAAGCRLTIGACTRTQSIEALVANPNTPADYAEYLLYRYGFDHDGINGHQSVLGLGAGRADLTTSMQRQLALCRYPGVVNQIAANPHIATRTIEMLLKHQRGAAGLARNPQCPSSLLARLAQREGRAQVARNPNCSAELLDTFLTASAEPELRAALCVNPAMDPTWLGVRLWEGDENEQQNVLANPSLPIDDALSWFAKRYPRPEEVNAFVRNPNIPSWFFEHIYDLGLGSNGALLYAALHPNASDTTLLRLCATTITGGQPFLVERITDRTLSVAACVLRRPGLSFDVLRAQPLTRAVRCGGVSGLAPALDAEVVQRIVGLAPAWAGTVGELVDTALMIGHV